MSTLSKIATTCSLLCLGTFFAHAALDTLPRDTYSAISIQSVHQWKEDFANSCWGKLCTSEDFRPFYEDSLNKFHRRVISPLETSLHIDTQDFYPLLDGELTIALIPDTDQKKIFDDALVFIIGTSQPQKVAQKLDTLLQYWESEQTEIKIKKEQVGNVQLVAYPVSRTSLENFIAQTGVEGLIGVADEGTQRQLDLWVGIQGNKLILSPGSLLAAKKIITSTLDNGMQLGSIPAFHQHKDDFHKQLITGWISPAPLINKMVELVDQSYQILQEEAKAENKKLNPFFSNPAQAIRALRLDSISGIAFYGNLGESGFESTIEIDCPIANRAGITLLLNTLHNKPCPEKDVLPDNILSSTMLHMDLPNALRILDKVTDNASPFKKLVFLGFQQGFHREAPNVNISIDIVEAFGTSLSLYELPAKEGQIASQWVLKLPIRANQQETFLNNLNQLNDSSKRAIGIPTPLIIKKSAVAIPALPGWTILLSQENEETKAKHSEGDCALWNMQDSREKTRLSFELLTDEEKNAALPFPFNRLSYDKLPSYSVIAPYIPSPKRRTIQVTPQGLVIRSRV